MKALEPAEGARRQWQQLFPQHQQQEHKKKKGKKGKKKKKKQKKHKQQQQPGDPRNPLSRAFYASRGPEDGISSFVKKACETLEERKRRVLLWEATLLLGTHFMKQALQESIGMAADTGIQPKDAFWAMVRAKAGLEKYSEIVARAAGKRPATRDPPPDTGSGSASPAATSAAATDPGCSHKRAFEVIRDLDELDQEAQLQEEERETKRLRLQQAIQELTTRFQVVNFAT